MEKKESTAFIYTIAFLAGLGGFLFGYDTGAISGALLFLKDDLSLSVFQQEVTVSILLFFAAISAPFAGALADKFGRRKLILTAAALFVIAALLMGFAQNFGMLIFGRALVGIAIGTASFTVPLYVSELSPQKIRGVCIALNQLMVTIGILAAYGVDYLFAYPFGWRWMLGLAAVPGAALYISMLFLPQTPRWLLSQGLDEKALKVFERMGSSQHEIAEAMQKIGDDHAAPRNRFGKLLTPGIRKAVAIGVLLAIFQQITGINTVIYYAPTILSTAGHETGLTAILSTVGLGVVNVLTTVIALFLIDRAGRRPLLIGGTALMAISLAVLGTVNAFPRFSEDLTWFYNASLLFYIAGFAIGLGPIAWVFIAEAYPQEVRGTAMSLATFANWAANFLVAMTYLSLLNSFGPAATFTGYAILSAIAVAFAFFCIPETKGKSLEEIQLFWHK